MRAPMLLSLLIIIACSKAPEPKNPNAELLTFMLQRLHRSLIDGDSAKVRNTQIIRGTDNDDNVTMRIRCGELRAKKLDGRL